MAWNVPEGWRVASVTVDGIARDDLLAKGAVSFPMMAHSHTVEVVLAEGEGGLASWYPIEVTCEGAGAAGASAQVAAGADHLVTWQGANGARPVRVTVDGVDRPDLLEACALPFHSVFAAHSVHVVFPTPEGADLHTLTATLTGGPGTITGSGSVAAGDDAVVRWTVPEGYRVKSLTVDGAEQDVAAREWGFSAIDADHSVAVVLEMDLWRVDVTWEGQGTAGESALVRPGAAHGVTWAPDEGRQVLSVTVDGEDRPDLVDAGGMEFADIDRNHQVHVVFDRDPDVAAWYTVDVRLEGGPGTASGSGEVAEGADRAVAWAPAEGFHVKSVTVDGEPRPDLVGEGGFAFEDVRANHEVLVELEPDFPTPPGPDPEEPDNPGPDDPNDPGKPGEPEGPDNPEGPGDGSGDGTGDGSGSGDGSGDGSGSGDGDGNGAGGADTNGGPEKPTRLYAALTSLAKTGDIMVLVLLDAALLALLSGAGLIHLTRKRLADRKKRL